MKRRIIMTAGLAALTIAAIGCSKPAEKTAAKQSAKPAVEAKEASFEKIDSSLIKQVKYDAAAQELTIEMTTDKSYVYENIPQDIYKAFMSAPSKGKFYNSNIKGTFKSKE